MKSQLLSITFMELLQQRNVYISLLQSKINGLNCQSQVLSRLLPLFLSLHSHICLLVKQVHGNSGNSSLHSRSSLRGKSMDFTLLFTSHMTHPIKIITKVVKAYIQFQHRTVDIFMIIQGMLKLLKR